MQHGSSGLADPRAGKNGLKAPEEEHTVTVSKLNSWLDGGARSPNEQVQKNRLKERLTKR